MATQNEILELLLRAKKVGSGDKEMASGLRAVKTTYTELRSAISLASTAIAAGERLYGQTIGKTLKYAQTVRELSGALRLSSEETSRLIQVGDDYLISAEEIRGALEMAVKRGFVPSVENLAKLSDEVSRIASPTERAAKLAEIFGRNWAVLDPILQAGGDAVRANAAAISDGLVLSRQAIDAAREHELAVDALKDSYEAATTSLSMKFIPILTKLAQGLDMTLTARDRVTQSLREHEEMVRASALTYKEYVAEIARANLVAKRFGTSVDAVSEAYFRSARADKLWRDEHDLSLAAMARTAGVVDEAAGEIPKLSSAISAIPDVPSIWEKVFPDPAELAKKLQDQIDFIQAGGPELVGAIENVQKALSAGGITPEEASAMLEPLSAAADGLAVELGKTDLWSAAKQRAEEFGIPFAQAKADIEAGIEAIGTIPNEINIQIHWIMEDIPGFQHGGSVTVPGSGPPDSRLFMARVSPGETIDFSPPGRSRNARGDGGGGTTVQIFNQMDALVYRQRFRRELRGR